MTDASDMAQYQALGEYINTASSIWNAWAPIWHIVNTSAGVFAVCVLIFMIICYVRWSVRKAELGVIAPTPESLQDVPLPVTEMVAALSVGSTLAAELIDFAIRGYIKIYEIRQSSFLSPWAVEYELEIVRPVDDLQEEEKEVLQDVFQELSVGAKVSTTALRKDILFPTRLADNPEKVKKITDGPDGLRARDEAKTRVFKRVAIGLFILAAVTLSLFALVAGIFVLLLGLTLRPLTDKGLAVYRRVKGLRMYISTAQQSDGQTERLLPYAIMFGEGERWLTQLGQYYVATNTRPEWYNDVNPADFTAEKFANAVYSFVRLISLMNRTGGPGS